MKFATSFKSARRAGVSLIMVECPDPASVQKTVLDNCKADTPVIRWNMVTGLYGCNDAGNSVAMSITSGQASDYARPDAMLESMAKIPPRSIVLLYGAEKIISEPFVRQGLWNLRDTWKTSQKTIVLLVPIGTKLSPDLKDDIVVLDYPLPTSDDLKKVVSEIIEAAEFTALTPLELDKTIDAILGLSEFSAETALSMSLNFSEKIIESETLWARKRKAIEQTEGLKVWKGKETFNQIGGLSNAKKFFSALIAGKEPPRCIVFMDEIEKAIGSQGDTSGTSQAMLGTMLSWMEDKGIIGTLLIGVAGSGKSAISKALGNEAQCPTIQFDLTGMKNSLVGSSEARLRAAIATVDAIGQGRIMVVATCNSMDNMPPELKRRFKFSTMFFDLPTDTERAGIWPVYLKKYNRTDTLPNDIGWTGAEIKTCCEIADKLFISLVEASNYIVPIAKSGAKVIEKLRQEANGNYVSASYSGCYRYNDIAPVTSGENSIRKFEK